MAEVPVAAAEQAEVGNYMSTGSGFMDSLKKLFPDKESRLLMDFTNLLKSCHGEALKAIILYGSAASGDYRPGHSDINLLVILDPIDVQSLRKAASCEKEWNKRLPVSILYASPSFVPESVDSFPIEISDMVDRHIVLFGEDPFQNITVNNSNLRLELESELRGKLLRLKQAYVRDCQAPKPESAIISLMTKSLSSFITLFAAMLRLKGIQPPKTQAEIIEKVSETFGLEKEPLITVLHLKTRPELIERDDVHELFGKYLAQIQYAVGLINNFE